MLALTRLNMIAICRHFMSLLRRPISLLMNLKLNFPSLKSHSWGIRLGTGSVQPDPGRVQPLLNLPYPKSAKELKRLIGLFAYYARWISNYSAKIRPLIKASLPLDEYALGAIDVKQDLASATLQPVNESFPFTVETDASGFRYSCFFEPRWSSSCFSFTYFNS